MRLRPRRLPRDGHRRAAAAAPAGGGDGARPVLPAPGAASAIALAPVVSALNLHEVVLSGPLDVLDEHVPGGGARHRSARRTMPAVGEHVDLRFSSLGEDDVLLGAAVLVLDRELGVA